MEILFPIAIFKYLIYSLLLITYFSLRYSPDHFTGEMLKYELAQLQYIIKIVETGSMNEAAKQLFRTLAFPMQDLKVRCKGWNRILKGCWLAMDEFPSYTGGGADDTSEL